MKIWVAMSVATAALAMTVLAEEYEVTAEAMRSTDDQLIFTGTVRIEGQGLQLAADELVVVDGHYGLSGTPAQLWVEEQGVHTTVLGNQIDYSELTGLLELTAGGQLIQNELAITAGQLSYDINSNILAASGGVTMKDGTMTAHGDRVTTTGSRQALVIALVGSVGSPATITLPGTQGQQLEASAQRIDYNQGAGNVRLRGDAIANLGQESLSSAVISYDVAKGFFAAQPVDGSRVRAVIQAR